MDNGMDKAIDKIVALDRRGNDPLTVPGGNIPFMVIPDNCKVERLGDIVFNEHQERPERIKGRVSVLDPASFIEYYKLFSDPNSRTFGDEEGLKILTILDYHGANGGEGAPRWGGHQLTLSLRKSEEWKRWEGQNNKHMTQQQFAEFLEQNALDIVVPSPASIVEIANDLQAHTEVEFASGLRQSDGQVQFKYTEQTRTAVGAGQVQVPDRFTVGIPAFIGAEDIQLNALLRFRVNGGKLLFWFTLIRPEEVVRKAFLVARAAIQAEIGSKIISGSPDVR